MIPHLFSKYPLPENIPEEIQTFIREFSVLWDKEEFLEKAFYFVVERWWWPRYRLFFTLRELFQTDIDTIIQTKGYMHCTLMNYILRVILIKSGFFDEEDIKQKLTHTWYITIHQYLRVYIEDWWYRDIDPWGYQYGIEYGKYSKGFNSINIFPVN